MRLHAISDLHLDYKTNREALGELRGFDEDWLILAGDIGHRFEHFHFAFEALEPRFARLIWVPGNHDLWTTASESEELRGAERYARLVDLCREYNVITPEDPYVLWPGQGSKQLIVPLFLLYDYSFRPETVALSEAVAWAKEGGVLCTDEYYLFPDPFPSREAWCAERCRVSEERIHRALYDHPDAQLILINHWPLLQELAVLPRVPHFTPWCGTRHTNHWHKTFPVSTVIYGHLHIRRSLVIEGVRFEEVSLGYPRNWDQKRELASYLRQILSDPL